jgi:hypothetical protein
MNKKKIKFKRWINPIYGPGGGNAEENHPIILTDFGFYQPRLNSKLTDLQFWVMETNFDIDAKTMLIVENTPGIEILLPFSSYTIKFTVGNMFSRKQVFQALRERLCGSNEAVSQPSFTLSQNQMASLAKTKLDLDARGVPYLIYVLPNGESEVFSTTDKKEFETHYEEMLEAQEELGGKILIG